MGRHDCVAPRRRTARMTLAALRSSRCAVGSSSRRTVAGRNRVRATANRRRCPPRGPAPLRREQVEVDVEVEFVERVAQPVVAVVLSHLQDVAYRVPGNIGLARATRTWRATTTARGS